MFTQPITMKPLIVLVLLFITAVTSRSNVFDNDPTVELTIAYCPTLYTGGGATVHVNAKTGQWKIARKFKWPNEIFGCPALYNPTITYDQQNNNLFLMFGDELGFNVVYNTVQYVFTCLCANIAEKKSFIKLVPQIPSL
jgi:hypothetical protein